MRMGVGGNGSRWDRKCREVGHDSWLERSQSSTARKMVERLVEKHGAEKTYLGHKRAYMRATRGVPSPAQGSGAYSRDSDAPRAKRGPSPLWLQGSPTDTSTWTTHTPP